MDKHQTKQKKRQTLTISYTNPLGSPAKKKFKLRINAIKDKLDSLWLQSHQDYCNSIDAKWREKKSTPTDTTTRTHRRHRFDSALTHRQASKIITQREFTSIPITKKHIKTLTQGLPYQQNQEDLTQFIHRVTEQLELNDLDLFIHFSIILKRYYKAISRQAKPFLFTTYDSAFLCAVLTLQFHGDDFIFVESTSKYATLFRIPETETTTLYSLICRQTIELLKLIDYKLLISNQEKEAELLLHVNESRNGNSLTTKQKDITEEMTAVFNQLKLG